MNQNEVEQADARWAMLPEISHEASAQREYYWLADSTDPDLPAQTVQTRKKGAYALKAGWQALGGQLGASYEQTEKFNRLNGGGEEQLQGRQREFNARLNADWPEGWRAEAGYTLGLRDQDGTRPGSVTQTAYAISDYTKQADQYNQLNSYNSQHTRDDRVDAKLSWQSAVGIILSVDGLYNRNEDPQQADPLVHTASGGAGLAGQWQIIRVELGSHWARSWGALATEQENHTVNISCNPAIWLNLALRGSYGKTRNPDSLAAEASLTASVVF